MRKQVYVIPKRARPLSNKKFCSLDCMHQHLKEAEPDWEMVGVSWDGGRVHSVSLADKGLFESRIRYRG